MPNDKQFRDIIKYTYCERLNGGIKTSTTLYSPEDVDYIFDMLNLNITVDSWPVDKKMIKSYLECFVSKSFVSAIYDIEVFMGRYYDIQLRATDRLLSHHGNPEEWQKQLDREELL